MKIYLYGIQGVYNYGCEAMIRGISEKFKNMYPDCKVIYKTGRQTIWRKKSAHLFD